MLSISHKTEKQFDCFLFPIFWSLFLRPRRICCSCRNTNTWSRSSIILSDKSRQYYTNPDRESIFRVKIFQFLRSKFQYILACGFLILACGFLITLVFFGKLFILNFTSLYRMNPSRREVVAMFNKFEKGQGLVEYALILVLIAIVVIAALLILGPTIKNVFNGISNNLATRVP